MAPYSDSLKKIISQVRSKDLSVRKAFEKLKDLPYADMGFARLDTHRAIRRNFPEVIYSQGKSMEHLEKIVQRQIEHDAPLILTKADDAVYMRLCVKFPQLKYDANAGIIHFSRHKQKLKKGFVAVVTAGTSDIKVAQEAVIILRITGNKVKRIYDVGVAGIHRVLDKRDVLAGARVIIVIAGMEGALASVVAGLVSKPIIAVPTSVGYGSSFKGIAPLLTMLNCCAPGVVVVNIDNGFGAAYFANMI